jgi:hypothetical protein
LVFLHDERDLTAGSPWFGTVELSLPIGEELCSGVSSLKERRVLHGDQFFIDEIDVIDERL